MTVEIALCGPFHYEETNGFEAWGYRFPSGLIVLEWIPESVPEDGEQLEHYHQSVFHSFEDFRKLCDGTIQWGKAPDAKAAEGQP